MQPAILHVLHASSPSRLGRFLELLFAYFPILVLVTTLYIILASRVGNTRLAARSELLVRDLLGIKYPILVPVHEIEVFIIGGFWLLILVFGIVNKLVRKMIIIRSKEAPCPGSITHLRAKQEERHTP